MTEIAYSDTRVDDVYTLNDFLKICPHTLRMNNYVHYNGAIEWCREEFGEGLYDSFFRLIREDAKWEFWCNQFNCIFFFKNKDDAMRVKLMFG